MRYKHACSYEELNPRYRPTMEDVCRIVPRFGNDKMSYFAVYDGHGGESLAFF